MDLFLQSVVYSPFKACTHADELYCAHGFATSELVMTLIHFSRVQFKISLW